MYIYCINRYTCNSDNDEDNNNDNNEELYSIYNNNKCPFALYYITCRKYNNK